MSAATSGVRRDRAAAPTRAAPGARSTLASGTSADRPAGLVVVIESDVQVRAAIHQLLTEWGLRVAEADLDSTMPVRDDHVAAAAVIADYELGASVDRSPPFNGLDIALLIRRRAARNIPILVTSGNFGRHAIPACSPYRIPVIFKPIVADSLRGWLAAASLITDAQALPRLNGGVRSAA